MCARNQHSYTLLILALRIVREPNVFTDELRPIGGFILAETIVQNGATGDNGTAGETLNQPVLGFLVG